MNYILKAILTKVIVDNNKNKYSIGDTVKFNLLLNCREYSCLGKIADIREDSFMLLNVVIDGEMWSESLPLIARYKDVKYDILTKL